MAPSHCEISPVTLGHHRADQNQVALESLQTWHTCHKPQIGEDRPALGLLRYPGSAGGRTVGGRSGGAVLCSSRFASLPALFLNSLGLRNSLLLTSF